MKKTIVVTFVNDNGTKTMWVSKYISTHPYFINVKTEKGYIHVIKNKMLKDVSKIMGIGIKVKRIEIFTETTIYKDRP